MSGEREPLSAADPIDALAKAEDPFRDTRVEDPWEDVPTEKRVHAMAAAGIEDLYREVADGCKTRCVLLQGEPGSGKTHLVARLARSWAPSDLVAAVEPTVDYFGHMLHVVRGVVASLTREANGEGPTPMARLAEHVRTQAVANLFDGAQENLMPMFRTLASAIRRDPAALQRYLTLPETRAAVASHVADHCRIRDERVYGDAVKAILRSLEPALVPTMRRWFDGEELAVGELEALGVLRVAREKFALDIVRTFGCLASTYAPLVFVFDRIESLLGEDVDEPSLFALADIVGTLRKSVPSALILFLCTPDTWETWLKGRLRPAIISAMEDVTFVLHGLRPGEAAGIVAARLDRVLAREERPYPTWPFPEPVMAEIGAAKTPRAVLAKASEFLDVWRRDPRAAEHVFAEWGDTGKRSIYAWIPTSLTKS